MTPPVPAELIDEPEEVEGGKVLPFEKGKGWTFHQAPVWLTREAARSLSGSAFKVLSVLYTFRPVAEGSPWRRVTRRQLAAAVGRSDGFVAGALVELVAAGLVVRKAAAGTAPGRVPTSYRLPAVVLKNGKKTAETREEWIASTGANPSGKLTGSEGRQPVRKADGFNTANPSGKLTGSGRQPVRIPDALIEKDQKETLSQSAREARRERSGKVGEVWEKFVAEAWPIIGKGAPAPALTPPRRKQVAEALDLYGEADVLATIPFLARVEFLRDKARLPADLAFRPEQIEAAGRLRAGGSATTPKRQLPAPPDGFTFPNGTRWSTLYGRPVPANEWKADPTRLKADPKAPPPPKDGDPLGPDSRWSSLWWRPLRMNEWTPDPNAGHALALLEEFGIVSAGAGATIPDEGDPTPSGNEIGAQTADMSEGLDAFDY